MTETSASLTEQSLAKSVSTRLLEDQPSCIEFSKHIHDIFVIGTYRLDSSATAAASSNGDGGDEQAVSKPSRSGTLLLLRLEKDKTTTILQTHVTSGAVLDFQFSPHRRDLGAAALSTGRIALYRLATTAATITTAASPLTAADSSSSSAAQPSLRLEPGMLIRAFEPEVLVLALAWNPDPHPRRRNTLAVSLSDGRIATLDLRGLGMARPEPLEAHACEAWTVAWSVGAEVSLPASTPPPNTFSSLQSRPVSASPVTEQVVGQGHFLYSGGDDNTIRAYDMLCEEVPGDGDDDNGGSSIENPSAPTAGVADDNERRTPDGWERWDARTHGAGVTAILPLRLGLDSPATAAKEEQQQQQQHEILLTGSYDEYLRVLVPTTARRWKTLAEERLGGGVWRLKLLRASTGPGASTSGSNIQSSSKSNSNGNSDGGQSTKGSSSSSKREFLVLASCMHAGARVVRVSAAAADDTGGGDCWSIDILARFEEHQSMNYGSDAVATAAIEAGVAGVGREREGEGPADHDKHDDFTIVSTSFYDRRLCVWGFRA